ncbi:MAG: fasciclin domain-containing protein, partial [Bacteroidales bacterium]|nr:fasciclin domain-containing protein [Bacteroidales bacterium]
MKKPHEKISMSLALMTVAAVMILTGCREEESPVVFFQEDELLISSYLDEHVDDYSSLIRILEITDLRSTLNAYGQYTFFAPDDDAFDEFCSRSGKNSVEEFERDYLASLVRYHLID